MVDDNDDDDDDGSIPSTVADGPSGATPHPSHVRKSSCRICITSLECVPSLPI